MIRHLLCSSYQAARADLTYRPFSTLSSQDPRRVTEASLTGGPPYEYITFWPDRAESNLRPIPPRCMGSRLSDVAPERRVSAGPETTAERHLVPTEAGESYWLFPIGFTNKAR